jgi:deoxyribonuclease-4
MSIAGGLELAFDHAERAGCDCLEVFVKNQRQWSAKPIAPEEIERFKAARVRTGIQPVVAHATYLINLASPDRAIRKRSLDAITDELLRCEALCIEALIFHPGAHMGAGIDEGVRRIAASIDEVYQRTAGIAARLLLECTAGQGSAIGAELSELGRIIDEVRAPDRLGVCLDTCHLFAAGYDIRNPEGYARMMDELHRHVGPDRVRCIHVNDSVRECGSRVDRHAAIGKGKIGKAGFAHVVNEPKFAGVPMILETPKGVDGRGTDLDRVNLKRLRGWVTPRPSMR